MLNAPTGAIVSGHIISRRGFLARSVAVLAAPLAAEAQPPAKVYRIGLFHVGLDHVPPSLEGLRDGLKVLGYEEGKNLKLDFRNVPGSRPRDQATPGS